MEDSPLITFDKMSTHDKFKEVHQLMRRYPAIMFNRLQSTSTMDITAYKTVKGESASKWFFKRASARIWGELKGYTTHLVLNHTVQSFIILLMVNYIGLFSLNAFLTKSQIKLPYYLSWIGVDSTLNEFYTRSITLFYTATLVHLVGLGFLPHHTLNMSDILSSIYYGIGLVAVMLESLTLRFSSLTRRVVIYSVLLACMVKFSRLSLLTYGGEKWYREECEKSRIDMDCTHFPHQHVPDLADTIDGSNTNASVTNTIFVGLAGQVQTYTYVQGQEAEADKHVAIMKQQSFAKAAQNATGVYRFNRVVPTPAISPEEAVEWAKQVYDGAVQRINAADERAAAEEKKNNKAKVDNEPIIDPA